MALLLALTLGGLVMVLLMPGRPEQTGPWAEAESPTTSRWSRYQRLQAELLSAAGIENPVTFRIAQLLFLLGSGVGMGWMLGPFSSLPGAVIAVLLTNDYLRARKAARVTRFADQFRDFLLSLVNNLRAGRSIPQAIEQSHRDLIRIPSRAKGLLAQELVRIMGELGRGASLDLVLDGMVQRVPLEEIRLFADAVSICRTRGGNLVQVLQSLIRLNADRFQVQQEIRVQTAEKRLEGTVLSLLPLIMLGLLSLASPDYMAPLTSNPFGTALIALGLMVVVGAYLLAQRLSRVEL